MISFVMSLLDLLNDFWMALQHGDVPSLGNWNYVLLYFFSLIQGQSVKILSGAASAKHLLNLYLAFGVTSTATLTLDFVWYSIGRSGKMERFISKRSQKKRKYIQAAQEAMKKNAFKVIVIGKFASGVGVPIHISAGISKVKWQNWLPATLIGEGLFTGMLIMIGYFMAGSLSSAGSTIQIVGMAFAVILLAGIWILMQSVVRKMIDKESQQTTS